MGVLSPTASPVAQRQPSTMISSRTSGAWKATPILKNLQVRYAQPLRVFLHEELSR